MTYPTYITIDLVRQELQDRTPADNSIDCDLFFSDEDILHAMERATAKYNALAPIGIDVQHHKSLPANTSVFLDAILSCLYGTAMHKLSRNLMKWATGDSTVELESSRMEAFSVLKKETEAAWREAAKDRKMEINRQLAWAFF